MVLFINNFFNTVFNVFNNSIYLVVFISLTTIGISYVINNKYLYKHTICLLDSDSDDDEEMYDPNIRDKKKGPKINVRKTKW